MWDLVETLTRLLAPIMPHTADEAFRALVGADGDDQCVHLQRSVDVPAPEVDADWPKVLARREEKEDSHRGGADQTEQSAVLLEVGDELGLGVG